MEREQIFKDPSKNEKNPTAPQLCLDELCEKHEFRHKILKLIGPAFPQSTMRFAPIFQHTSSKKDKVSRHISGSVRRGGNQNAQFRFVSVDCS